ncbi:MAG: tRNA 4-thiouridine(8) synthase ThiI, partial [candidate division Zixibacteria bacterium]|nr:tRNA 4-thiouridine(8) synthase ThiI [candidate division Zixibacteria bacterium]
MSRLKALALLSGGLDSLLAIKLVQAEGVEIEGICFTSPFFGAERAEKGSRYLGISLHRQQIGQELISLLRSPPHGFGKGANPCIDCHILMIKKAGDLMRRRELDFLISGEVLGQRPKSQSRWALELISRKSEWGDLLLRPLTAKNLSPTLAERKGWVRREKLWGIKGRSRLSQLELASKFGLKDFPAPSGGCLLTDPIFSRRMKDLL